MGIIVQQPVECKAIRFSFLHGFEYLFLQIQSATAKFFAERKV